ncbi:unnamed protein product [Zymoseptoria tritici ST99CH_1A5]|uniref:Major facilitator superfamily (MFS) profile domain-containing protein n=1 Tax=Zymoseptoria tritici ST99CH_1A5 TaxID=1276529 RepID=A0A1Y6LFJ9_ZYMTR|nr:unnamed protein product [Zymoseptoria tritici ST99CH_1A5]
MRTSSESHSRSDAFNGKNDASQVTVDSDSASKDHHDHDHHHKDTSINERQSQHVHQQAGVSKVEAFNKALYQSGPSGRLLLYVLVASLALTMFAYALDQGITYQFNAIASSDFSQHASLGAVNTASSIIRAISKPFLGKLSDITSRPTTYVVVLVVYAVGFAVAASSQGLAAYIVGASFTAFGKSGLDLLSDIIVGDLTPLEWRAFWSGMLATPFLITTFINGFISDAFVPNNWRWGLGMFAIMMPVLLTPAIWTLYGMQHKAAKMGMVSMGDSGHARKDGVKVQGMQPYLPMARSIAIEMDLIGLLLLGLAFSLILLALNLAPASNGGWSNPSMIAMLVIGFVILGLFIAYEALLAPVPITPKRILTNKAFLCALTVDVFNQMASATRNNYWSSYIYIIKPWSNYIWTIFIGTTTLTLCTMSPVGGLIHRATHRYKTLMVIGAIIKLIGYGVGLDGNSRSTLSTARLAVSQVMLGMGAWTVIGARVGSQASVPHQDLSVVISVMSLWSTMASSIGSTIAATIWQDRMLGYMREECPPDTPEATLKKIYGSIKTLKTKYDWDDPVRMGAIRAYTRTNGIILAVSLVLAAVPVVFSCLMPNYYLGKQQNAVTNTDVLGERTEVPRRVEEPTNGKPSLWQRVKRGYYKET